MSRKQRDFDRVVYVYLNTVTEMVYVGSSQYGLEARHAAHMKAMKTRHHSRFYRALTDWPPEAWERMVLERCSNEGELSAAERRWIIEMNALDAAVGYNSYDGNRQVAASLAALKRKVYTPLERAQRKANGLLGAIAHHGAEKVARNRRKSQARQERSAAYAAMTPEERVEFHRHCGKKGFTVSQAEKSGPTKAQRQEAWAKMTDEERREFFREAGRRGAQRSKELSARP